MMMICKAEGISLMKGGWEKKKKKRPKRAKYRILDRREICRYNGIKFWGSNVFQDFSLVCHSPITISQKESWEHTVLEAP